MVIPSTHWVKKHVRSDAMFSCFWSDLLLVCQNQFLEFLASMNWKIHQYFLHFASILEARKSSIFMRIFQQHFFSSNYFLWNLLLINITYVMTPKYSLALILGISSYYNAYSKKKDFFFWTCWKSRFASMLKVGDNFPHLPNICISASLHFLSRLCRPSLLHRRYWLHEAPPGPRFWFQLSAPSHRTGSIPPLLPPLMGAGQLGLVTGGSRGLHSLFLPLSGFLWSWALVQTAIRQEDASEKGGDKR